MTYKSKNNGCCEKLIHRSLTYQKKVKTKKFNALSKKKKMIINCRR